MVEKKEEGQDTGSGGRNTECYMFMMVSFLSPSLPFL